MDKTATYEIIHLPKSDQKFLWEVLDLYKLRHIAYWKQDTADLDIFPNSILQEYGHIFIIVFPGGEYALANEPYYVYYIQDTDHSFQQKYDRIKRLKAFL
jgi:hypothetical protein